MTSVASRTSLVRYSGGFSRKMVRPSAELGRKARFKRAADVVGASAAILFLSPVLAVLYLLAKRDGGPAFYAHRRIGRGGVPFDCYKFRSMRTDGDALLLALLSTCDTSRTEWDLRQKLAMDPRVTPFGRFLRKTSLDELPQLLNILRGEMSLVGPRPVTALELERFGKRARDYMACTPGVTGLWQVMGRSRTSYRRRVALDSLYARRRGPLMDMSILLRTVPAVLVQSGAE